MTKPIAIFYHCLTHMGTPPELLPSSVHVIKEQMNHIQASKLLDACDEFHVGINGGDESIEIANLLIPSKANIVRHGLESRAENLTLMMIEEWVKTHPGWNVLYFHSKGATHELNSSYGKFAAQWRKTMMEDLVEHWRERIGDLDSGFDVVCSHWMWNMADGTQHIPAGNFLWFKSDFAAKLPTMYLRDRIKQDGIAAVTSRYEAEVYWGNGPKPNVKSVRPNGGGGVP